ncbi:hypothetical protein Q0F98_34105 [Paenibacillus amylolyticus]|nr:hypothetical protein Q0F98_34105 [Paenibacillus amylolyticus]
MISWIMIVKPDAVPPANDSSGLHAETFDSASATLQWDAQLGAASYKLYRSDREQGEYKVVYSGNGREYTDSELNPGTEYYYKVEAFDATGQSLRGVSSAYQVHTAQQSAADVATGITALEQPSAGAKKLKLPSVPQGFTVKIASSSVPSVIQTDGTIIPPSKETTVTLELEITRTSDDSRALTVPLTVKVLASVPSPGGTDPGSGDNPGGNSGGNSGNGSGSGDHGGQSGSGSPSAENAAPQPKPEKDRSVLELQGQSDQKGVVQSNVDVSTIKEAFQVAPSTDAGQRLVELRLKPVSGATAYEVSLPASALIDQGESHVFNIVTELGMLELPCDTVNEGCRS